MKEKHTHKKKMLANKGLDTFSFMGCWYLWKIFFEFINDKKTGNKINITGSVRNILFCKFSAIYSMKNLQKYNNLHLLQHLKKIFCYQSFFFFFFATIIKNHCWRPKEPFVVPEPQGEDPSSICAAEALLPSACWLHGVAQTDGCSTYILIILINNYFTT